jgi:hypothetical protein
MGKKLRMEARRQAQRFWEGRLKQAALAFVLCTILVPSLASCLRHKDETLYLLGEDVAPGASATLVCSEQCRDSSQCGMLDSNWVVLASSSGPATESHDLTFPDGVAVTVTGQQQVTLQYIADPARRQQIKFYAVEVPDIGSGWVAGWCIGQPIVP